MTAHGWIEIALFLASLTALTAAARRLHGARLPRRARLLVARARPVERALYRLLRRRRDARQDWKGYARSVLVFSRCSWLAAVR